MNLSGERHQLYSRRDRVPGKLTRHLEDGTITSNQVAFSVSNLSAGMGSTVVQQLLVP